jgi:hypothetical protein
MGFGRGKFGKGRFGKTKWGESLWEFTPQIYKNSSDLRRFYEAMMDIFENIKAEIETLPDVFNPQKTRYYDEYAKQYGFILDKNNPMSVIRRVLEFFWQVLDIKGSVETYKVAGGLYGFEIMPYELWEYPVDSGNFYRTPVQGSVKTNWIEIEWGWRGGIVENIDILYINMEQRMKELLPIHVRLTGLRPFEEVVYLFRRIDKTILDDYSLDEEGIVFGNYNLTG